MGAHIVGRPDDDLLDILLGPGAEPEQALIGDRDGGAGEGHRSGDPVDGEAAAGPER